jgi:predicted RNA-binding Zn-ribbon protein involved in translation (DUF1610 family)
MWFKNNITKIQLVGESNIRKDYKERKKVIKCPNCGANMDINHSGKCDYCGQTYNQEDYDWVLKSMESN